MDIDARQHTEGRGARPAVEAASGPVRSSVGYDVVLCTKRLVRAFDDPECARRCARLVEEAMARLGIASAEVRTHEDHILLRVRGVPAPVSPADVVNKTRSATSVPLRAEFGRVSSLSSLWNAAALVRNAGEVDDAEAARFRDSLDARKRARKSEQTEE